MGRGLWQRGVDELLHELRETECDMRRRYAAALELIAELDSRDAAVETGYPSLADLLRDALRITPREARRRIGHAHAVTETLQLSGGTAPAPLPATAHALRAGTLDPDHLDVITRALTGLPPHLDPERITATEHTLVTAAASMDARTLTRVGARVRATLDQDGAPPDDRELAEPVNELHCTTRTNGRLAFRGELEPEASALFTALLSPLAKPRPTAADGPDPRTPAERNGDALAELLHLAATHAELPTEAGERPHVLVTVPLQALRTGGSDRGDTLLGAAAGDIALLERVPVDAGSARRIACDAKVIPAVLGSAGEPLDLGRASYTVTTALRRALVLRDRGCAFPGCDRPHRWCHSHHVTHWADGGPTNLHNLVLLCGAHHRLLHHAEWECAIINGQPEFYPPRYICPERKPRRNIAHALRE